MAVFVVAWFGSYIPGAIATIVIMVGLTILAALGKHVTINPLTMAVFVTLSLVVSRAAQRQPRETELLADRNVALDKKVQVVAEDLATTVGEGRSCPP